MDVVYRQRVMDNPSAHSRQSQNREASQIDVTGRFVSPRFCDVHSGLHPLMDQFLDSKTISTIK